jgi:hypothetical protein
MLVAMVGLCFIAKAQLMRNPGFIGGLQSGAASACSYILNVTTHDGDTTVNAGDAERYVGGLINLASGGSVDTITFVLTHTGTTIAGKTYTCYIYSLTGNDLNAVVSNGTSTGVTGSDGWSSTTVTFTFPVRPTISSSTSYGVVLSTGVTDGAAGVNMGSKNSTTTGVQLAKWNTTFVNTDLFSTIGTDIQICAF